MLLKPVVWVKDANLLIEENRPSVCSVYLTQALRLSSPTSVFASS